MTIDIIFLIVIAIFAIMSAMQGFMSGLLSLLTLIISALISYYYAYILINVTQKFIPWPTLNNFIGYAIVFLISYFILSKLAKLFHKHIVLNKALDLFLGAILGAIKGFLLVAVIIILLEKLVFIGTVPNFLLNSQIRIIVDALFVYFF